MQILDWFISEWIIIRKAIIQLDEAVKIEPKDPNIRLIRAKAFDLNNDTEKAIKELEETLKFASQ